MAGNLSKSDDGEIYINGNTDGTLIGNVGDRLKVDASFSTAPTVTESRYATFVVLANATATANNKSMVSITNATGTSVKIRLREIRIINVQNTPVTGVVATFNLLRCTSHSDGTSITPQTYDTTDTLDANVTARTGATITGESASLLNSWRWSTDEWTQGAHDVESDQHKVQTTVAAYSTQINTKPLTLNANQGFTIKCVTNTTTGLFDLLLTFTQE